ncbi:hypothetical protein SeLEV6574_g07114 [Synchytrium endobioticum]|nr:hypothetical protein SeLEV6574_g07114 [Synchytrium endobioticum]
MAITVTIKCPQEVKINISFESDCTVGQLKENIAKALESTPIPTPANQQRLIYSGRILKDEELLSIYKIQEGNTLHMVKGAAPKSAPTSIPQPTTVTESAPNGTIPSTVTAPSTPGGMNTNPLPNPFANQFTALGAGPGGMGMGGANPFGGGGMPPMGMGTMDPNMMANLLRNPQVSASVAQMMSNPQFVDNMISSNPQMAAMMTPEMRAMMSSPEFTRMMADPNVVRQAMAMAPMLQGMGSPGGMGVNPFGALGVLGGLSAIPGATTNNSSSDTADSQTGNTNATTPAPGGMPPFVPNPALLQMLLGGGDGPFGAGAAAATGGRAPEELYEVQLRQLQDMGFYSAAENLRALTMAGGNVDAAVEWLLSHPPGGR